MKKLICTFLTIVAFQKDQYVLVYDKKKKKSFINKYDEEAGGGKFNLRRSVGNLGRK